MKNPISLKSFVLLAGMGAAFALAPACKAQEVNPDHFDGTDSWAQTPAKAQKPNQSAAVTSKQGQTAKNNNGATLQLASSREVTKAAPRKSAIADRKRKPASTNPEKK